MPSPSDDAVRTLFEEGARAWPRVTVAPETFAAFVRARAEKSGAPIRDLRGADLYLACACAEGDPRAIAAFDEALLARLPAFLGSRERSAAVVDEVLQLVRERLFVAARGAAPKIAEYSGRGALESWLRAVALRVHANLRRTDRDHEDVDDLPAAAQVAPADPEMQLLRERYHAAFDAALRDAFTELPDRERAVLRLQFLKQLTLDQIALVLQVHRATVARCTASARAHLFEGTRRLLRERLRVTDRELESLLGVLRSQLDVSLAGVLRETAG